MGNCQAADAVAIVIHHPSGGQVERAYGAVTAAAVMAANPGHYVAAVVPAAPPSATPARRRLKLLRPDDMLAPGGVYRLVSFEEVLREFVSKRHAVLSRVAVAAAGDDERDPSRRRRVDGARGCDAALSAPEADSALAKGQGPASDPSSDDGSLFEHGPRFDTAAMADSMVLGGRFGLSRHGQWRPALPSIAEGSVVC